ncbi:MAG: hypothetical protein M0P14_03190, partial [Alkaliphilus sp.]|nr:hypothetical protein [Alkaliphilus sp.]
MVKTELQKQLDTATLGPMGFLSKSIASSLSSIGQLIKSPKLLLPTIILSIIWAALSYLKLAMPYSGFIALLSTLTFAQGGMYAGFMGAVGGVLGKALISYIVTSMLMPILAGKKSQKSVGMKIGPAFAISGGGFALFFAGIGAALMLYNFKTGNGTAENMAIAVASIFGVFRSLKNPRGFIVEFIRSFSKGKMSRKKAGHFGAGLVFGYAVSILMAVVTGATGPLWYKFGTIFILLAVVLAFLSVLSGRKNRKNISSVAGVILVATILFGQILLAGSISYAFPAGNAGFLPAYESYNIREDDFEALKNAIINKPFKSAEITPIGVLMGLEYAPIKNSDSIVISEGEKTSLNISVKSASIDEQYRLTDIYSFMEISFEGKLELFFDKGALEGDHYNKYSLRENRLPIYVQSSGVYKGGANNRSDWRDGEPTDYFSIAGDLERYPVIFTDYKDLVDCYYSDSEKALYGDSLNPGDSDGQLYLIACLTGGNKINYSDGESVDGSIDAYMLFRVDEIGFNAETHPTTAIRGNWVHKGTDYYAFNSQGVDRYSVEYFDGLFKEEAGVSDDGNTLFHIHRSFEGEVESDYKATFSPLPKTLESEQKIVIKVDTDAMLNGVKLDQNEPNERIIFGGIIFEERPEYIPGGLYDDTDDIIFSFSGGQLIGNMPRGTTAGEEVVIERIMGTFGHPGFLVIADTYVWEVQVVKTDKKDQGDEDIDGEDDDSRGGGIMSGWDFEDDWGFGDDWGWDESADGPGRTAVNIASVIGGIVGAGAAVAGSLGGGFGGPGGPGNFKIPGGDYDPSDGTLIMTYPGGSQEMYVLNPETGNFEDNRGYILDLEGLDRHMKDMEKMRVHAQEDMKRMVEGTDGYSAYWKRLENLNKLKEKYEDISERDGDKISTHMANHLNRIQADINAGKGVDEKALGKVMNLHGKITRGEVADYSELPGDYTNWQHAKDTMSLTTEEVARGETGLAISLRILSGILTGGKSEMGFEVARSVYLTKDHVDQGMDNWSDITSKLAARTIKEEALGRFIMGGLKYGGKAVGKVAEKGSALLKTTKLGSKVLDKLGSATKTVGDFLGQDIIKTTKDIFGISSKTASDTAKVMKSANAKAAREAIKRANKQLDDAVKAAGRQADDVAKAAAKQAESAGKTAAKQVEKKIARDSAKMADSYEQATKQWNNAMKKGNNQAIEEIQKYRDANLGKSSLTSQREQLFRKGQQIGDRKVANLKSAQDRLTAHPNAKDAQNAYDQAMRAVQQDKYAMNS